MTPSASCVRCGMFVVIDLGVIVCQETRLAYCSFRHSSKAVSNSGCFFSSVDFGQCDFNSLVNFSALAIRASRFSASFARFK